MRKYPLNNPLASVTALFALLLVPGIVHAAEQWKLVGVSGADEDSTQTIPGIYDHPDYTLWEINHYNGAINKLFRLSWANESHAVGYCPTNGLVYHTCGANATTSDPVHGGNQQTETEIIRILGYGYQDSQYMES